MEKPKPDLCETCTQTEDCDRSPAHRLGQVLGKKGWQVWACTEYRKGAPA